MPTASQDLPDNFVPTVDARASTVTGVLHLPALISGVASGGGIQAAIFNPKNATDQVAGFRFHTASGWNVMLRTRQGAADLELTDGTGAVRHLWSGTSYTTEGRVSAGALAVTEGPVTLQLPGLPSKGTTDLTIDSEGNVAPQKSSLRFKEQVEPLEDDFQKVLRLQPRSFRYRESGDASIGYLAEEVAEHDLPGLVAYDGEGRPLSVHYKLLPVYLLEVLKEQQGVIEALQREVRSLHERLGGAPAAAVASA